MSRDGVDRRRNIFDAFLSFVKIEKDEECRPCSKSIKRVSESSRDGFSPTPSSTSSLGDLWIKPESDLIQDPALLQPPAVARDKPTLPEPPIPPFDTNCSDPTLSGPDLESRISSPLPALCISSVTNISHPYVPPVDKCNIASVDTQSTLAPIIPTPTVADDSTCRVECLSPAPEVQPDSLSAPHDNTSSWSFSFGCLDDLLSQGDPCRSTYIQYKCTKLRYPLPLAAAMAKLYGPSKIPVLTSDPQCDSNTPAVETFLSKSRSRDQGFLEIDDSHFTVSNGSTSVPSSVSFTVTNHTVPKPLTKAQLRHAQTRRETRQSHSDMIVSPTTMEVTDKCSRRESTAVPRSERTNPGDRRRRFSIANKRRSTGLLITSKPLSVVVQSEQAKISSSLGAQPCKSPNSVVICTPSPNLTPENPTLGPPQCNESCADSPNIVKNSRMSSPRSLDMHSWYSHFKLSRNRHSRQRLKPVVAKAAETLAFQLLSSHHFVPADTGLHSRNPHWAVLRRGVDAGCSSAYCLLFGDAIRMLCCVDAMSSVQILDTVLAHCASTYCMVDSRFVCLQTQNTRVSLSPLQSIGSFKLTVIPCPKFSALHELLRLALENMPLSMDLISCARLNHMISMCRSLVRYGQNSPLMRGLPRANLPYVCQLVTEAFRSITEQLDPQVLAAVLIPCLHREPDAVELDLPDNAVPADLISYLSPFWWRVLSTALLNPNHILGLGVLTRSFQLVYRQLFHNSSLSVDQSDTPLFFSFCHRLSGLHRHVSSCLSHLRDTYASLVSAGSCLSARVRLSRPDECDDSASLKLEQGRARLFASAQAARNNVARILRNEIIPYLRVLFEECEQYTHMLNRFVVDSQLMGPFLSDTPYLCSPECRRISLTIKQSLITLERQCSIQWTGLGAVSHTYNTPSAFYQIAIRMHNFLEKQLANFLVSFQTSLFHISHSLKSSLRAIDSTWLSAFACPDGEHVLVDSRAASDVQLLASKLQEQYDLIETFIRNHHNTSIPMFYDRMSSIQSLLMKTGLNRTQIDGTHLLLGRVRIPYGSKNKPEDVRALDTLRNTVSVPDWPPTPVNKVPTLETNHANQTSSNSPVSNCVSSDKQSLPVVIMRRSVAPTVYVVPPRPGTDGSDVLPVPAPKKSSWYVVSSKPATGTQVIRSRNNPGSVNMNSSPPEYSSLLDTSNSVATTSSGSTTGTKRVCIRLSHEQHTLAGSTEIIEQRPFKPGLNISTKMPFIRAVRMDRRRLGRLKRRMKISHSSCIQNRSRRSGQPEDMSSLDLCSHNSDENSRQLLTDEAVTICSSDDEDRNSQKNSAVAVNSAENSPGRIEGVTMPPPADLSGTKLNLVEKNLQRSDIHFDVLSTDVVINYSTRDGTVESHNHTAHAESGKQQPTVSFLPDRSLEPSALDRSETATPDMNISSALVTTGSFVWNSSERPVPVSPRIVQDKSHANQDGVDCTDVENARFQSRPFSSNTQSILETEDLQTSPLVIGCNHHSSTNESDAMRADSSCDIAKNDPERTNATGPNNLDSRNLQTEQNSTDFDSVSRIPTSVDPRPSAFPDSVENCHLDVSASKCCYSPTTIAGFPSTVDTDHVRVQSAKVQLSADFKNNTHMNDSDSLISLGSLSTLPDTHHSTRIGILLERVTAELGELAPWFDKYDSSQCPAPGPITAAALGQMSPQSTAPTLSSVDLTSEDC